MKNSRFKFEYRSNASKLHKKVGNLLRENPTFKGYEIYQEYPVNRVFESYSESSHHFDWVIPRLNLVFECHGRQHYDATAFSSNVDLAVQAFQDQKSRDKRKKEAACKADFIYVEIPYYLEKKLDETLLVKLIEEGKKILKDWREEHIIEVQTRENKTRLEQEQKAKLQKEKRLLEQKQIQKEKRQAYLKSQEHRKKLAMAREFRKKRYRKMKEKFNG